MTALVVSQFIPAIVQTVYTVLAFHMREPSMDKAGPATPRKTNLFAIGLIGVTIIT
jgi:hypothetical protein